MLKNNARKAVKENIIQEDNAKLEGRVDRWLEIKPLEVIGGHYFAEASTECLNLYRDGYFLSVVMLTQSVNEALIRFVKDKNEYTRKNKEDNLKLLERLKRGKIVSSKTATASQRICRSWRGHIHHLNKSFRNIPIPIKDLARRNIKDLLTFENEIFHHKIIDGKLVPSQPQYWEISEQGTGKVFLRIDPPPF